MQSQKLISDYLISNQILSFGFVEQSNNIFIPTVFVNMAKRFTKLSLRASYSAFITNVVQADIRTTIVWVFLSRFNSKVLKNIGYELNGNFCKKLSRHNVTPPEYLRTPKIVGIENS